MPQGEKRMHTLTMKEQLFQQGQTVFYQGEEARVLDIAPVLTIITKKTNRLICGDSLINDLRLKCA